MTERLLMPSRLMLRLMVATDVGFLAYWLVTALHLLPPDWLYNDYQNPMLVDWNWSFVAIDVLVSATGFTALIAARRKSTAAVGLALVSLTLTSASGLMAIAFWTLRHDFEWTWWMPNAFLLLYPLPFIKQLVSRDSAQAVP
jgi:hypothetical protein